MNPKNILLGIVILILGILVIFYGINTLSQKSQYEKFCKFYNSKSTSETNKTICPSVCIPMYEIIKNQCVYNECGSGCGPNNISTFSSIEQCEQKIQEFKCSEYSENLFKFILSLIGLIILIFWVYYFNKKIGKKNEKYLKIAQSSRSLS